MRNAYEPYDNDEICMTYEMDHDIPVTKVKKDGDSIIYYIEDLEWGDHILHRIDGPALYNKKTGEVKWCYWGLSYNKIDDWAEAACLSKESLVKLKLTYGV